MKTSCILLIVFVLPPAGRCDPAPGSRADGVAVRNEAGSRTRELRAHDPADAPPPIAPGLADAGPSLDEEDDSFEDVTSAPTPGSPTAVDARARRRARPLKPSASDRRPLPTPPLRC